MVPAHQSSPLHIGTFQIPQPIFHLATYTGSADGSRKHFIGRPIITAFLTLTQSPLRSPARGRSAGIRFSSYPQGVFVLARVEIARKHDPTCQFSSSCSQSTSSREASWRLHLGSLATTLRSGGNFRPGSTNEQADSFPCPGQAPSETFPLSRFFWWGECRRISITTLLPRWLPALYLGVQHHPDPRPSSLQIKYRILPPRQKTCGGQCISEAGTQAGNHASHPQGGETRGN